MSESFKEQVERVVQMSEDHGETWDLSPNDQAALKAVLLHLSAVHAYLSRLLTHYAPDCEPLPDLLGLCSQVDNLLTGLNQAKAVAPSRAP
jgi:hypothetical protein